MGNCFSSCTAVEDDDYHPSSSIRTQNGRTIAIVSAASAEVSTLTTTMGTMSVMSGPCSPDRLTSAEVSGRPTPSGPSVAECLTSAEVSHRRLTSAEVSGRPTPSGPNDADRVTSAEVSDCRLSWSEMIDFPAPSGPLDEMTTENDIAINLSSFMLHSVLGAGAFGKVVLATRFKNMEKVAIKSVIKTDDENAIETERYVLERAAGCPFLTQLHATFQTRFLACFVMEYVCGGNLLHFMTDYAPLDRADIKFITAETSCGLEFLHRRGILHRDIKLENILMDRIGHIRIADFGLAIAFQSDYETATGRAGTFGYMAPEVVNNDFYRYEPDWFSLGVLTYILATERRPFRCRTPAEYRREVNFCHPVYPPDMDPDLLDFIKGLLCRYPDERLGVKDDIQRHPFFDSIDWEELEEGRTPPPFPVDAPTDMEVPSWLSPSAIHPESSRIPAEEIYIPGFTYISSAWARM